MMTSESRAAGIRRLPVTAALVFFLCVAVVGVAAHELGTSQVAVTFRPNATYRVEVISEPAALLARLAALTTPLTGVDRLSETERIRLLEEHAQAVRDLVDLRFDGVRAEPRFAGIGSFDLESVATTGGTSTSSQTSQADQPHVAMQFDGELPPGAKAFTISSGLVLGSYPLIVRRGDTTEIEWLQGSQTSEARDPAAVLAQTRTSVALQYLALGFTHILPKGLDHILFVLGIFFLSTRLRPILLQVTTFTLAHSITLGLTMYGIVSLPPTVVEPLIALSIVYVAVENLFTTELKPWRLALVFGFGLLHGMGFAGVLSELGLPRREFVTALLTFNLGVEAGQLTVILIAFALVAYWHNRGTLYRQRVIVPASLLIALTGLYWTFERL